MRASIPSPTAAQLGEMELFKGLSAEALRESAASGEVQYRQRGSIIFMQGAPADRCHALLCGQVRIAQSGAEGNRLIVRFVGTGEMFGTMALFTDRRYPAEAATVIDSVEISWTETALLALIQRYPQIALNLVRIVGARLREVQERLRELATERVDHRIAHALLRLSARSAPANSADPAIDFPLTRQDVAQMCGATLYTASRILRSWERAGWISTRRGHISIRKPAALLRVAGQPHE